MFLRALLIIAALALAGCATVPTVTIPKPPPVQYAP